jgi:hypothetical protein
MFNQAQALYYKGLRICNIKANFGIGIKYIWQTPATTRRNLLTNGLTLNRRFYVFHYGLGSLVRVRCANHRDARQPKRDMGKFYYWSAGAFNWRFSFNQK